MTRRIPDPCPTCKTIHWNACPSLWGGTPERPTQAEVDAQRAAGKEQ